MSQNNNNNNRQASNGQNRRSQQAQGTSSGFPTHLHYSNVMQQYLQQNQNASPQQPYVSHSPQQRYGAMFQQQYPYGYFPQHYPSYGNGSPGSFSHMQPTYRTPPPQQYGTMPQQFETPQGAPLSTPPPSISPTEAYQVLYNAIHGQSQNLSPKSTQDALNVMRSLIEQQQNSPTTPGQMPHGNSPHGTPPALPPSANPNHSHISTGRTPISGSAQQQNATIESIQPNVPAQPLESAQPSTSGRMKRSRKRISLISEDFWDAAPTPGPEVQPSNVPLSTATQDDQPKSDPTPTPEVQPSRGHTPTPTQNDKPSNARKSVKSVESRFRQKALLELTAAKAKFSSPFTPKAQRVGKPLSKKETLLAEEYVNSMDSTAEVLASLFEDIQSQSQLCSLERQSKSKRKSKLSRLGKLTSSTTPADVVAERLDFLFGEARLTSAPTDNHMTPPADTDEWETLTYEECEDDLYYEHSSKRRQAQQSTVLRSLFDTSLDATSMHLSSVPAWKAAQLGSMREEQCNQLQAAIASDQQPQSSDDFGRYFMNEEFRNPSVIPQTEGIRNILLVDRTVQLNADAAPQLATTTTTTTTSRGTRSTTAAAKGAETGDNAEWHEDMEDEDFNEEAPTRRKRVSSKNTSANAKRKRKVSSTATAKVPWTEEEVKALFKGYAKFPRNWKKIRSHDNLLERRTAISIKEKYRKSMVKAWEGDDDLKKLISQYIDYDKYIEEDNIGYSATQYRRRRQEYSSKRKRAESPAETGRKSRKKAKK